ncbi:MAG: hypothetical protein EOP34_09410, partial [Rickettsiales bacterium]
DFKYNEKPLLRLPQLETVNLIIDFLTNFLTNLLGDKHNYMCVLLKRPSGYFNKKNAWIDGIHLQFPYIVCDYMFQFALRNKFIKSYKVEFECVNDIKDIYDEAVITRNNWCLYRSTKQGVKPYDIFKIFNSDLEIDELNVLQRVKLLSIRNKSKHYTKPIDYDIIQQQTEIFTKNETKILQQNNEFKQLEIKQDQEYDEKIVRRLLNILKQDRVENYTDWINIGMILHYCEMSSTDKINYYELWNEWSKKSNKYSEKACKRQWRHFNNIKAKYLTIASLFYYAKQDNLDLYKNFRISEYIMDQRDNIPISNFEVGKIIEKKYGSIAELSTNRYCPFIKEKHKNDCVHVMLSKSGWCVKCSECKYEQWPENEMAVISKPVLQSIGIHVDKIVINNYNPKDLTIFSAEYDVFDDKTINEYVYASLNGSSYYIAHLMLHLYKNKFKCTDDSNWYMFKKHRWTNG